VENGTIVNPGGDGIVRTKDKAARFDRVSAEERWHFAHAGVDQKDSAPAARRLRPWSHPPVNTKDTVLKFDDGGV
jgi:hypothetical protein